MTLWHLGTYWEKVADAIPDAPATVHEERRQTWGLFDDRAARLAQALVAAGLKPDAKVAIFAHNSPEYLETQYAAFKTRIVAINVNYRYVEEELAYLFDNSDAEAVVYQAQFAPRLAAIRARLPKLKTFIEIEDGSGAHLEGALDYEKAIAAHRPMSRIERSGDDIYMFYTGGTTGMPKGVMYVQADFCPNMLSCYDVRTLARPTDAGELAVAVRLAQANGTAPISIAACPLMHGTGLWLGAFVPMAMGGSVVTMPGGHFDPDAFWRTVVKERVTDMAIVGDVFAKPMLAALRTAAAKGAPYDVSAVKMVISSGVMFSSEVKRGLLEFCDATIFDAMGSTEGGMGLSVMSRLTPAAETARFAPRPTTKVLSDDGREVQPGSGEVGMIANGGAVPVGYYKDPEKSARTFRVVNGQRYSFPGDYATVAADGTLVLLGRGSVCINTGGEKVYPEEVEEAIKTHETVRDCLVVGVPDERFGERVVAVLSLSGDADLDVLSTSLRRVLAGYKLPKAYVIEPEIRRGPNGKADYKWAKQVAADAAARA